MSIALILRSGNLFRSQTLEDTWQPAERSDVQYGRPTYLPDLALRQVPPLFSSTSPAFPPFFTALFLSLHSSFLSTGCCANAMNAVERNCLQQEYTVSAFEWRNNFRASPWKIPVFWKVGYPILMKLGIFIVHFKSNICSKFKWKYSLI